MSTTFHHDHERAVVRFGGDLDWASAMEFVDIVDGLVSHYFYKRTKVVVTSPGGATAALDHVVRALERWRNASADAPPHHADPTDRFVAERLADAAAAKGRMRKARSVRALARAVGRAVDAAVERGDRARVTRLYRALFATGLSISAELARTLRLIDRIGVPDACALRPAERPGLTVPEWRALYPPHGTVPRKLLTRHVAILGETGSGKTVSAILPVVGPSPMTPPGSATTANVRPACVAGRTGLNPPSGVARAAPKVAARKYQPGARSRISASANCASAVRTLRRLRR